MTMATRIVVMKDGLIQQVDTPQRLYDEPVNIFVAGFIGTPQMNFLNGALEKRADGVYFIYEGNALKLPEDKANNEALAEYIGKEVVAGLRPECIHDDELNVSKCEGATLEAHVDVTELMGAEIYLYLKVQEKGKKDEDDYQKLTARVSSRSTTRAGDVITVGFDMSRIHIFDKDTERCVLH
jgi:multiple sugar transport system ATP-binding protein